MGIQKRIFEKLNLVVFRQSGLIDDREFVETYASYLNSDPGLWELDKIVDLREARSEKRTASALELLAEKVRSHGVPKGGPARLAIVAPSTLSFGLARMFEAYLDRRMIEARVFRTPEPSLAWLEVPPGLAQEIIG